MKKRILVFFYMVFACQFNTTSNVNFNTANITFLNVGQGSATILEYPPTHYYWIDLGNNDSAVLKWQQQIKQDTIDAIIITHPDLDHFGAYSVLIDSFIVKKIYLPIEINKNTQSWQLFLSKIKETNIDTSSLLMGSQIKIAPNVLLNTLWPTNNHSLTGNNLSYVLQLHIFEHSILLTGDIEKEAELNLLNLNTNLKSDILKVAHHGSSSSSSLPFLNQVKPSWAIISSDSSVFGHPHTSTLNSLKQFVNPSFILRTDQLGSICFSLNPQSFVLDNQYCNKFNSQ